MSKNNHNLESGSSLNRSDDRIIETQEVFTPMELCHLMVQDIPLDIRKNPKSTFLDNSSGSGNFIVALLEDLQNYHSREHIISNMLYAVELMEDNHIEMCERIGISTTHPHFVCHDALTYDYSFSEPLNTLDAMLFH